MVKPNWFNISARRTLSVLKSSVICILNSAKSFMAFACTEVMACVDRRRFFALSIPRLFWMLVSMVVLRSLKNGSAQVIRFEIKINLLCG